MEKKEQLSPILKATTEMLKHFGCEHEDALSRLRDIKTELFELNIRLDELNRTRNLYSLNTSRKKNVFSPIQSQDASSQKETELMQNIEELTQRKHELEEQQAAEQEVLRETEDRLRTLRKAQLCLIQLSKSPVFEEEEDAEIFEYVETDTPDIRSHGEQILLLEAFDKTYLATILKSRVATPLSSQTHRLENLRRLITTDPEQARLMLEEFETQNKQMEQTLQTQLTQLHQSFDEKRPIQTILDEWIMEFRDKHPEFVLDSSTQVKDESLVLPYIYSMTIIQLIELLFDNVVHHANANQIRFRVQITGTMVDVFLSDNGIGIPEDAYKNAPWYSSLHKAEEMLFLLDGRIQISGSKGHGTTARFTLPL